MKNKNKKKDFTHLLQKDKLRIKQDLIPVIKNLSENVTQANINTTTQKILKIIVNSVRHHFHTKYKWSIEECNFIGDKEISAAAGTDMFDVESYDYSKFQ